jgi:hypothetical protein
LDNNAKLPIRESNLVAGIDIMINQDIIILPGQQSLVNTGITFAVPPGTYARTTPQNGLAVKHGIDIGVGVIDEYYQGEIKKSPNQQLNHSVSSKTRRQDCTTDFGKDTQSRSQGNNRFIGNNKRFSRIWFNQFRRDSKYKNHILS